VSFVLNRRHLLLLMLLLGLVMLFCLSLSIGSLAIPLSAIWPSLLHQPSVPVLWQTIVWQIRLPKALAAILAGAALGVSGLQLQILFRNPLADPFILGTNAGASLGVAILLLGGGIWLGGMGGAISVVTAASIGAGLALLLVLALAQRVRTSSLLLVGLMLGYLSSALLSVLLHFGNRERTQAYLLWTNGSFGAVTWAQLPSFAGTVLLGILLTAGSLKPLNALLMGENYAASLGVPVRVVRNLLLLSAAVLSGAVTAFCGPIGFLGLAVPHLTRALLRTADTFLLLPGCVLLGGILALLADWLAQLPGSQSVLPLNAITALLGAPLVLFILLRSDSAHFGE
jgi:iron complex transport system permease protein